MSNREEFLKFWKAIPDRALLETCPVDETVREPVREDAPRAVYSLPTVDVGRSGGDGLFSVKSVLGRGGMGIVHLASQGSMSREVALKEVDRGGRSGRGLAQLLREGHVMGYLEHPNIVPVHVFAQDQTGQPFIAMKRIDGHSFQELLDSNPGTERLAQNLEILRRVCNALEYAHARGVLHLDLKPANIMVGAYGEAYVVDWGTAVGFREDVPETIPRFDRGHVIGTACYIAPEMLDSQLAVGAETDVFLLGGILHAILAGRPPHGSGSQEEVLCRAFTCDSPRIFSDDVPAELGAICARALQRDPEYRFTSVREFRVALERYEAHASAEHLVQRGMRQLEALQMLLDDEHPDDAHINRTFGAARQLLDEAQQLWPHHSGARASLQKTLEEMIAFELRQDNVSAAMRLLRELPEPNSELDRLCEAALAREQVARVELDALRKQIDPIHEARPKAVFLAVAAAVIALLQLVPNLIGFEMTATSAMGAQLGLIAVMTVVSVLYRERLLGTLANRSIVGGAWVLFAFGLCLRVGAVTGRIALDVALALDLALVTLLCAYVAMNVDRRILAIVPGYTGFTVATALFPGHAETLFAAAHVVNVLILAAVYYIASIRRSESES